MAHMIFWGTIGFVVSNYIWRLVFGSGEED